jgi:hypothetical protein
MQSGRCSVVNTSNYLFDYFSCAYSGILLGQCCTCTCRLGALGIIYKKKRTLPGDPSYTVTLFRKVMTLLKTSTELGQFVVVVVVVFGHLEAFPGWIL